MEVIQYQGLAGRTINPALTHEQMQDHALKGMVGEIGEINSIYQKVYQGHEFDEEQLFHNSAFRDWWFAGYSRGQACFQGRKRVDAEGLHHRSLHLNLDGAVSFHPRCDHPSKPEANVQEAALRDHGPADGPCRRISLGNEHKELLDAVLPYRLCQWPVLELARLAASALGHHRPDNILHIHNKKEYL